MTFRIYGTTFLNNGTFGNNAGSGDGINLETGNTSSTPTITGTGTCYIGRTRILYGNSNPVVYTIDQNMTLNYTGGYSISAYYSNAANSTADNYTLTINAGKVVTATGASGVFHATSSATANPGGNYTYNINGTLDAKCYYFHFQCCTLFKQ